MLLFYNLLILWLFIIIYYCFYTTFSICFSAYISHICIVFSTAFSELLIASFISLYSLNPICHGVFLTFMFSWLTNVRGLMLLSTSHPPFMNKMSLSGICWRHFSFGDAIINERHLPKFPVFYVFAWHVLFLHAFNIFFVFIC